MNGNNHDIGRTIRKALSFPDDLPFDIAPIARGGSQRSFYRVRIADHAGLIFMRYDSTRQENAYYAAQAEFLRTIGVSVPAIFFHDAKECFLIMEDLGETDLWSYRHVPWEIRKGLYCKVLAMTGKLHAFRQDAVPADLPLMEAFAPALYRWEQDYFLQNFVSAYCRVEQGEAAALTKEFEDLIARLAAAPTCLIHRDLQSQNIMVRDSEPVLIDFQGMRYGNPLYDLGSLLYDPYVPFTDAERKELLQYYYRLHPTGLDGDSFQAMFLDAAVQRLMQAIGAYGFLGLKGNRRTFLAHIPSGLDNLLHALRSNPTFEHLRALASHCRESLPKALDV